MPPLSALSLLSTPGRGLPQHFESRPIWRARNLLDSLFPLSMSHSTRLLKMHPSWMKFWRYEDWNLTAGGVRRGERTEGRAVISLLYDGQMDGWMACANCCLCFAALLHSRLPKAFSDAWCAPNGFPPSLSLWALFIWALVLWIPPRPSSLFIVPSLFLTVDALDVLMLFILKWQSILHCCCCFFYKYIYR